MLPLIRGKQGNPGKDGEIIPFKCFKVARGQSINWDDVSGGACRSDEVFIREQISNP